MPIDFEIRRSSCINWVAPNIVITRVFVKESRKVRVREDVMVAAESERFEDALLLSLKRDERGFKPRDVGDL